MFAKRSQILKNIETVLKNNNSTFENASVKVLEVVELFMEPKLRPLTEREVNEHVLVTQVHESRKEEVRNFVRNLDYEMKREFVPEDA
jgi:hypothetical protein